LGVSSIVHSLHFAIMADPSPSAFSRLLDLLPEGLSPTVTGLSPTVTGSLIAGLLTLLVIFIRFLVPQGPSYAEFPLASLEGEDPKSSWFHHGRKLMIVALEKFNNQPFKVLTGTGPKIIVPNRFAKELRNHPSLNFNKAFVHDFFPSYPGMEPLAEFSAHDSITAETIRTKLTQSLGLVTEDLVDETTTALTDLFGNKFDNKWQTVVLKNSVLDFVARLSSRVFLGKHLCRESRWLEIARTYAVDAVHATFAFRMVHPIARPIAHWFMSEFGRCRKAVKDAHKMIDKEVVKRKARVDECLKAGKTPPKMADTIGWMHETAMLKNTKVDYVAAQLSLTMAAIHTTTEVTCQAIFDIIDHPEVLQPLRQEIIEVISKHGWAKTTLYHLKLMDSFLKESTRHRPRNLAVVNRMVETDVTLSDGTVLPKNSLCIVLADFSDPQVYPEPEKFDPWRFVKARERPGEENAWHMVTVAPEQMTFGIGQHACPGRFFAANEVKIALCHMLLKYDWRWVPGKGRPESSRFELEDSISATGEVQFRRRREEINLNIDF
ncbi:cytochrome P450, partial [Colletotrichum tofieldiae]